MFRCSDVICFIQINQPIVILFCLSINCLFIVIAEEARKTIAKYEVLIESNELQNLFYLEASQSESEAEDSESEAEDGKSEATDGSKSEEEPSRHKIIGIGS